MIYDTLFIVPTQKDKSALEYVTRFTHSVVALGSQQMNGLRAKRVIAFPPGMMSHHEEQRYKQAVEIAFTRLVPDGEFIQL